MAYARPVASVGHHVVFFDSLEYGPGPTLKNMERRINTFCFFLALHKNITASWDGVDVSSIDKYTLVTDSICTMGNKRIK